MKLFHRCPLLPVLAAVIVIILACRPLLRPMAPDASLTSARHLYSGVVTDVKERPQTLGLTLIADSIDGTGICPFKLYLTLPYTWREPHLDERMAFKAQLQPVTADRLYVPNQTDYGTRLIDQGVGAQADITRSDIERITPAEGWRPAMGRLRTRIVDAIVATGIGDDASSFLAATLMGDASMLDIDRRVTFSHAGIAHVVALSGLHVAVIAWMIGIVLAPLMFRWRVARFLITIAALWGYAALTGLSPSVVRAVTMATIALLGLLLSQRRSGFNAMFAAAIIILVADPASLFTAGFQFTFLATASILLVHPLLEPTLKWPWWTRLPVQWLGVSVAAMVGTVVAAVYWFHVVPLAFLLANVVAMLALPPLLVAGTVLTIASLAGSYWPWLEWIVRTLYDIIDITAVTVASWPGATVTGVWLTVPSVIAFYGAIALVWAAVYYRRKSVAAMAGMTLVAGVVLAFPLSFPRDEAYLTPDRHNIRMIARSGDTLHIVAHGLEDAALAEAKAIYSNYLSRRGITTLAIATDSLHVAAARVRGSWLSVDSATWYFHDVDRDQLTLSISPDNLVVGTGFTGDIKSLALTSGARTIHLSRHLHPRRRARYAAALDSLSIPNSTY